VRGAVAPDLLWTVVAAGAVQMILSDPDSHYYFASTIDTNRDGTMTADEVRQSYLVGSLLEPDLTLHGQKMLSLGFAIHAVPCDAGSCSTTPPADHCHDRVQDGDETGLDCGGSCGACKPAVPSCSDGVRDGLETDVDCGWNCGPCAQGKRCADSRDCATGHMCSSNLQSPPGRCL
jgi:hypothetical protein